MSGRLSISTAWDSKGDLEASESWLAGPRSEVARAAGAPLTDVWVEIFETAVVELSVTASRLATRA
jgi:hypothetical protein